MNVAPAVVVVAGRVAISGGGGWNISAAARGWEKSRGTLYEKSDRSLRRQKVRITVKMRLWFGPFNSGFPWGHCLSAIISSAYLTFGQPNIFIRSFCDLFRVFLCT